MTRCDDCGDRFDEDDVICDDAGVWCEECHDRQRAESLEAVGGEAVARAHAQAIRAQREYDMEGMI